MNPHAPPSETIGDDLESLHDDVLIDHIDDLAAVRESSDDRDAKLRAALRQWGGRRYGTVDAFCVVVAGRVPCTVAHARNALFIPKSQAVLDEAVALYREETGSGRARQAA